MLYAVCCICRCSPLFWRLVQLLLVMICATPLSRACAALSLPTGATSLSGDQPHSFWWVALLLFPVTGTLHSSWGVWHCSSLLWYLELLLSFRAHLLGDWCPFFSGNWLRSFLLQVNCAAPLFFSQPTSSLFWTTILVATCNFTVVPWPHLGSNVVSQKTSSSWFFPFWVWGRC